MVGIEYVVLSNNTQVMQYYRADKQSCRLLSDCAAYLMSRDLGRERSESNRGARATCNCAGELRATSDENQTSYKTR